MSAILGLTRTLALIKPHAVRHRFAILRRIRMSGFHVLQVRSFLLITTNELTTEIFQERCVKLTGEQATAFLCRELSGCDICMEVVELSSGPAIVLCLSRDNAVEKWKELMGPEKCSVARQSSPTCLRALYGDRDDDTKNAVYGSETDDVVTLQLHFFFPNSKQSSGCLFPSSAEMSDFSGSGTDSGQRMDRKLSLFCSLPTSDGWLARIEQSQAR